jgi:hypothetical protein
MTLAEALETLSDADRNAISDRAKTMHTLSPLPRDEQVRRFEVTLTVQLLKERNLLR